MFKKETYLMDDKDNYSSVTYSIKKIPWADILKTIDSVKKEINKYLKQQGGLAPWKSWNWTVFWDLQVFEVA
jgi:hypothetical protein